VIKRADLLKTRSAITITSYMEKTYDVIKKGGDKLALLGLFAFALLIARFIVASKSAILLSQPIALNHAGLSVSMPAGNGWNSEKQWRHQENAFYLSSKLTIGPDNPAAQAYCRYLLCTETTSTQTKFEQKAFEYNSKIMKTGRIKTEELTFDWALMEKPKTSFGFIFGTAKLPHNHQLDIEVHQVMNDSGMAEQAFQDIVDSLNFEDNELLEAGTQIISEIKSRGLGAFFDKQNQQAFFLLKDSKMRAIGFSMDVVIDSGPEVQPNIQAAGLFYIKSKHAPYTHEQVISFEGSNNLDEFVMKSDITNSTGTEITVEPSGLMTVRKSGSQSKSYHLSHTAIPEIFIEQLISQVLDSDKNEIIVDIIEADGKISPMLVSGIETKKDVATDEVTYLLELELLDGRGYSEQVFLNEEKQVFKKLIHQRDTYILESTTSEDIMGRFPEWTEYILQADKMLK
jgi:hypothetical protein